MYRSMIPISRAEKNPCNVDLSNEVWVALIAHRIGSRRRRSEEKMVSHHLNVETDLEIASTRSSMQGVVSTVVTGAIAL